MKIILNNSEVFTAVKEYLENHKIISDDGYSKSYKMCICMKKADPDKLLSRYIPFIEVSYDDY